MNGWTTLNAPERDAGIKATFEAVRSNGAPAPLLAEMFSSFAMPELSAQVDAAELSAAASIGNIAKRVRFTYLAALRRDARYVYAGRRQLQALGLAGNLRGLYEGGKQDLDAS